MGKSLTEVARGILSEGNYPSVDPMGAGHPDRGAKTSTVNSATLRPNAKGAEGRFSNPNSMAPQAPNNSVEDLGPALVKQGDVPPSAKAAGKIGKDTSKSSKSSVAAEKPKKQAEVMEEDVELDESEEFTLDEAIEAFIEHLAEEGLDEDAIMEAVQEEFGEYLEEEQLDEKAKWRNTSVAKNVPDEYGLNHPRSTGPMRASSDTEPKYGGISSRQNAKVNARTGKITKGHASYLKNRIKANLGEEEENLVDMSEHVEALFAGEELSEEFKQKAITIFEAAVTQKLEEELANLEEAYAEALEEEVAQIQNELTENVDDYLNYVVEQWVSENEVAIESNLRTELTEDFISGLRQLFAENYIDIPDERVSVVEEMSAKVLELEEKLNEEIERNVSLTKMINESSRDSILADACDGLTATQAEKLKSLSEGIAFTTADEFSHKLDIIKENYFTKNFNTENVLDPVESSTDGRTNLNEATDGRMAAYVRTLGKKLPN
jgi:hypothetical protein